MKLKMTKKESDFGLVETFNMGSSLNGITPEHAFALGIEWQMFRERLKMKKPFSTLCLSINASHLVRMAKCQRRFVEAKPTPWASWSELSVGDDSGMAIA